MDLRLDGKNALVCGGSKGIGRASAEKLASLGANVTIVARDAKVLGEVVNQLPNSVEQKHSFLAADFNDPEALRKRLRPLVQDKKFAVLVNNTGGPAGGAIVDANLVEFEKAFRMHLMCNHVLVEQLLPGMKSLGFGRIINVISTSVKQPLQGLGVSNTIRGAVANWSKTLANEVGQYGITVNNVLPGATSTGRLTEIIENKARKKNVSTQEIEEAMTAQIPARRFGKPEEIGAVIAFLSSPIAGYINGVNIPVDGGRTKSL